MAAISPITAKLSVAKTASPPDKSEKIQEIFSRLQEIAEAAKQPTRLDLTPFAAPNWAMTLQPKKQGERIWVKLEDFRCDAECPMPLAWYKKKAVIVPEINGYRLTLGYRSYWIQGEEAKTLVKQMAPLLNGNRYEVESHKWTDRLEETWNMGWKELGDNGTLYREKIYPLLQAYAKKFLDSGEKRVLEVCGGDGELAEKILKENGKNISAYYLLDTSEVSCQNAKARHLETLSVHQQDVTQSYDFIQKESIDLVIGCGALSQSVLYDSHSAKRALKEICRVLKKGGILLLSGRTQQWINSKDLNEAGFSVKNMTIPPADPSDFSFPCYVAIYQPTNQQNIIRHLIC